jgi:hypothetical protein
LEFYEPITTNLYLKNDKNEIAEINEDDVYDNFQTKDNEKIYSIGFKSKKDDNNTAIDEFVRIRIKRNNELGLDEFYSRINKGKFQKYTSKNTLFQDSNEVFNKNALIEIFFAYNKNTYEIKNDVLKKILTNDVKDTN